MLKRKIIVVIAICLILTMCLICVYTLHKVKLNSKDNKQIFLQNDNEPIAVKVTGAKNKLVLKNENNKIDQTELKDVYYLKVNYQQNVVTVFKKDENGTFTVPYDVFICSCGEDTPTGGVYIISDKYEWRALVNNVYGQYATRISGSILFHSVPYEKMYDKSTLKYWEYDKLGQSASAGCVRLRVCDAKWIYDNCEKGSKVEFYASEEPGPMGRPIIQKISDNEECRNWDPTDRVENNPWLKTKDNKGE